MSKYFFVAKSADGNTIWERRKVSDKAFQKIIGKLANRCEPQCVCVGDKKSKQRRWDYIFGVAQGTVVPGAREFTARIVWARTTSGDQKIIRRAYGQDYIPATGVQCGDVYSDVCDDVCDDVCSDVCDDVCSDVYSDVCGDVCGDVCSDVCSDVSGDVCSDVGGGLRGRSRSSSVSRRRSRSLSRGRKTENLTESAGCQQHITIRAQRDSVLTKHTYKILRLWARSPYDASAAEKAVSLALAENREFGEPVTFRSWGVYMCQANLNLYSALTREISSQRVNKARTQADGSERTTLPGPGFITSQTHQILSAKTLDELKNAVNTEISLYDMPYTIMNFYKGMLSEPSRGLLTYMGPGMTLLRDVIFVGLGEDKKKEEKKKKEEEKKKGEKKEEEDGGDDGSGLKFSKFVSDRSGEEGVNWLPEATNDLLNEQIEAIYGKGNAVTKKADEAFEKLQKSVDNMARDFYILCMKFHDLFPNSTAMASVLTDELKTVFKSSGLSDHDMELVTCIMSKHNSPTGLQTCLAAGREKRCRQARDLLLGKSIS